MIIRRMNRTKREKVYKAGDRIYHNSFGYGTVEEKVSDDLPGGEAKEIPLMHKVVCSEASPTNL